MGRIKKLWSPILSIYVVLLVSSSFNVILSQGQVTEPLLVASSNDFSVVQPSSDSVSGVDAIDQPVTSARRMTMPDIAENLPLKMELSLLTFPVLFCESRLSLTLDPETDVPNTEVRIVLPEAFSLVNGNLVWHGDLLRNIVTKLDVVVRSEEIGSWCIEAVAYSRPAIGLPKICSTQCYVQVTETEGYVFDVAPEGFAKIDAVQLYGGRGSRYVSELGGNLTVYGAWHYEDQQGDLKPVRYAMVQLWADTVSYDACLATTYVQSDGFYEFPSITINGTSDIYVRLVCNSYKYDIVSVRLSSGDPRYPIMYLSETDVHHNVTSGYHDMGNWSITGEKRECWAIYDGVVDGYFWLLNRVGWHRSKVYAIAQSAGGMSYSTGNDMVFESDAGWDRDTVLHEYGHCINYAARGNSFPPSDYPYDIHYPDTESDGGWAFREGWAEFFPCAVDNTTGMCHHISEYGSIESTTYADGTFGHGDYGDWDGSVVEGAVAQVLWDIFDGEGPRDYPRWDEAYGDCLSNRFDYFWEIFCSYRLDSIDALWAKWNPKDVGIWAIFHHARILKPRNVMVTNVEPLHRSVALGETASVNVTIQNKGDTAEIFNLTVSVNGSVFGLLADAGLGSGMFRNFIFEWDSAGMVRGDYMLFAQINQFPGDSSSADNSKEGGLITLVSSEHDVCIESVAMQKTIDGSGFLLKIGIIARNFGNYPETLNVTISANLTTIKTFSGVFLESGIFANFTVDWNTTGCAKGNYSLEISASPVLNETNIGDNIMLNWLFVTFTGDVDRDLDVDELDVAKAASIYSLEQNEPGFNPYCDIDNDGSITILDIVLCTAQYGQKWT